MIWRFTRRPTFETLMDARGWVADERRRIDAGTWTAPAYRNQAAAQPATFGAFASAWLADRPLKPRSRELYADLLDQKILPTFGDFPQKSCLEACRRAADYYERRGRDLKSPRRTLGNSSQPFIGRERAGRRRERLRRVAPLVIKGAVTAARCQRTMKTCTDTRWLPERGRDRA
jgi:hypothetical protein